MIVRSIKILCRLEFPSKTIRLWDGSGPYMDLEGKIWQGSALRDGLDIVESAINGEAYSLALGVSGVKQEFSDLAYQEMSSGDVIDSVVQLLLQDCDENDTPVGAPQARFTGTIDNIIFSDSVDGETQTSIITIECVNRFALRNNTAGSVLSDIDQKARSAKINPGANPDRFAERVPVLADQTIWWPRFT